MHLTRTIGICSLGLALVASPVVGLFPDAAVASAASSGTIDSAFAVTSDPVFRPGDQLTVSGTAPRNQNVWVTLAGADRNDPIAFSTNWSGAWDLTIPAEYTTGKDTIALAFHHGPSTTIEQTFTASDAAVPAFEVTSDPVFRPGDQFTVSGTAPRSQNVWVTLAGADRNDPIALSTNWSGAWDLTIPAEYTTGKDTIALAFHHGPSATIEQTFTKSDEATPSLAITSKPVFTPDEELVVAGTAPERQNVWVTLAGADRNDVISLSPNSSGRWELAIPAEYTTGRDELALAFHHGTSTTIEQTFTASEQGSATDLTVSTKTFVRGQKQRIEGTAAPKAKVNIYSGSKYLMNVTADGAGKWSYMTGAVINDDTFTRILKSDGAEDLEFTLTAAEQEQKAPITVGTTTFVKGQKQLIEGTAQPKAKVNIYSGSKYLMNVTANAEGKWSYMTGAVINDDTFTRTLKSEGAKDLTFTLNAQ